MKKFFILLFIFITVFSGCSFGAPEVSTNYPETTQPLVTDFAGMVVPSFNNVEVSTLDPALFELDEYGRMKYSDPLYKTLCGIDVSNHQGEIDWEAVALDGIDFVMLRIGYRGYGSKGIIGVDESFERNYNEAKRVGLKVGVYFYSQAVNDAEAREEARFVLDVLNNRELDYPIAYDWEYVDNDSARTDNMTGEEITACALAFCDEIKKNGREVIIYFNCSIAYFDYDLSVLNEYDFWLAEYKNFPTFLYRYTMWQYSCTGKVSGISGDVDMNISVVEKLSDDAEDNVLYG